MIDFSVSIEMMFTENDQPFDDRVRAASAAGFPAVEMWDWADKDLSRLARALQQTGTQMHTLCVETWRARRQLADPASHAPYLRRVREAADAALRLNTPKLVVLAGDALDGIDTGVQRRNVADVLSRAADTVAGDGIELIVEVVNRRFEGPNALLSSSKAALDVVRTTRHPNLKFLYDRYHAILNGEALGQDVADAMPLVGHVQAADVPGRHEFGTGTIDWVAELAWLRDNGYAGYIGIEGSALGDPHRVYADAQALLS